MGRAEALPAFTGEQLQVIHTYSRHEAASPDVSTDDIAHVKVHTQLLTVITERNHTNTRQIALSRLAIRDILSPSIAPAHREVCRE